MLFRRNSDVFYVLEDDFEFRYSQERRLLVVLLSIRRTCKAELSLKRTLGILVEVRLYSGTP